MAYYYIFVSILLFAFDFPLFNFYYNILGFKFIYYYIIYLKENYLFKLAFNYFSL